jgi:hypothetical protein
VGCFPIYFLVFTVDDVFLYPAAHLTAELAISGHPIEGLV